MLQNSGVLAPHYPMPGTSRVCMDLCPRRPALTAAAGSAPRFCRPRYTPAAPACSPRRSDPTARGAAGTPISFWSARQSPPSPRFCRMRQNAWAPHLRRLAVLRSQQPQAPLHGFAALDIHPRHPLAHRAGQTPPRAARRGPRSHFGRPGRARPPQGFAACGKTLGRRTCGGSLSCAHSSRRLRSTVLPPSIYTRGTRLLTAQVSS